MKKLFIIALFLSAVFLQAKADNNDVSLEVHEQSTSETDTEVNRSLKNSFIKASFDNESSTLTINSDSQEEGEVFIYDEHGNLLDYSSSLNSIFRLNQNKTYIILIVGEGWYAEGILTL